MAQSLYESLLNVGGGVEDPATLQAVTNPFMNASLHSLLVILVTEIGDKTFFIAAVLAMRSGRLAVYGGAMSALTVMHVLSSLMGYALPALIDKRYTHLASAVLFLYFGLKLLYDSLSMAGDGVSEELIEVEEELVNKKNDNTSCEEDEEGSADLEDPQHRSSSASASSSSAKLSSSSSAAAPSASATASSSLERWSCALSGEGLRVFSQALTLTFLAEWGDRSQIATIALAASKNVYGVILGGLLGHAFCTGLAVLGGRMLAARISERTVAVIGGVLFLFFGVTSFMYGPE
eukprot:gene39434-48012_t